MTKEEVLKDMDQLCDDINSWTTDRIWHCSFQNIEKFRMEAERLLVSAHQELSFLRDYIEKNVKEE